MTGSQSMRTLNVRAAVAAVCVLFCELGCRNVPIGERALSTGGTVAERVGKNAAVVVVYNPKDCFSCDSFAAEWMALKRYCPTGVVLLFSRAPSQPETVQILTTRLQVDGEVKSGLFDTKMETTSARLFLNGKEVRRMNNPSRAFQDSLKSYLVGARSVSGPKVCQTGPSVSQ